MQEAALRLVQFARSGIEQAEGAKLAAARCGQGARRVKGHAQAVDEDGCIARGRVMQCVMQRNQRNRDLEEVPREACQRVKPLLL
ncbi:hypothetical protein CS8_078770 [Cupriavidus sp. 8B]